MVSISQYFTSLYTCIAACWWSLHSNWSKPSSVLLFLGVQVKTAPAGIIHIEKNQERWRNRAGWRGKVRLCLRTRTFPLTTLLYSVMGPHPLAGWKELSPGYAHRYTCTMGIYKPYLFEASTSSFEKLQPENRSDSVLIVILHLQEICQSPVLFPGEITLAHPKQGLLGDCWFLCACSFLARNKNLLNKVAQ